MKYLFTQMKRKNNYLTDMARYRDANKNNYIIQNCMSTRNAIEFCGLWEQLYNPVFKGIEFDAFKTKQGQTVLRSLLKNG